MTDVFHCFEFLLLKRLQEDPDLWDELVDKFLSEKQASHKKKPVQILSPELWFLGITLDETDDRFPQFVKRYIEEASFGQSSRSSLLSCYLNSNTFAELHLDHIFKYGEENVLPREIFKCPNVKVLSLRYNFLESLPPDVGNLSQLENLALTNNRLQNSSIPYTLTFCRKLHVLFLDNNLLDALPGCLLSMPSLKTVHRHGNHNYFKATFMWYHTDVNGRILHVVGSKVQSQNHFVLSLQFLSAQAVISSKINFYRTTIIPSILKDYISDMYFKFNICGSCCTAKLQSESGYKVFTFKNPYLGNTCVPFQHWACSLHCAEAIEIPARVEQILSSKEQDRQYEMCIRQAQDLGTCRQRNALPTICSLL